MRSQSEKLFFVHVIMAFFGALALAGCGGLESPEWAEETEATGIDGKGDSLVGSYCKAKAKRVYHGGAHIVAASPDHRRVVFAAGCKNEVGTSLRLFDLGTCKVRTLGFDSFSCAPTPPPPAGPGAQGLAIGYGPAGVVFSPDGSRVAFSGPKLGLRVWSALSNTTVKVANAADMFTFDPTGTRLLYTGPQPGTTPDPTQAALLLWSSVTGKSKLLGDAGMVFGASTSGGRLLLLTKIQPPALVGDVALFDFASGKLTTIASGASPLGLSADGGTVLLATELVIDLQDPLASSGKLARFAAATGKLTVVETFSGLISAALSPDGLRVAYLTGFDPMQPGPGALKLWQAGAAAPVVIEPQATPIFSGAMTALPGVFSPGGSLLAFGRAKTPTPGLPPTVDLLVYRVKQKKVVPVEAGVDTSFIRFTAKGSKLSYTRGGLFPFPVAELRVWDVASGATSLIDASTNPSLVTFTADEQRVIYLGNYYQPMGNIAADLDVRELSGAGAATVVASAAYSFALDPTQATIYFQRRRAIADPADVNVDLWRYDLGGAAPSLVDGKGSQPHDITASAAGVVYVKADGLYAAAAQ